MRTHVMAPSMQDESEIGLQSEEDARRSTSIAPVKNLSIPLSLDTESLSKAQVTLPRQE